MSSADQARELIKRLPKRPLVGAEVGVFSGKMSRELLGRGNISLYMVDSWLAMPKYRISQEQQDANRDKAYEIAKCGGRVLCMDSVEASKSVTDGSLDFVFLDADHSYRGVCRDIEAWYPKLKTDGLMSGHDYANKGEPCGMEVKRAVDEWAVKLGKRVELGKDSTWFYR